MDIHVPSHTGLYKNKNNNNNNNSDVLHLYIP